MQTQFIYTLHLSLSEGVLLLQIQLSSLVGFLHLQVVSLEAETGLLLIQLLVYAYFFRFGVGLALKS